MILLLLGLANSTELYNQANAEYHAGDYYRAIDRYEEALQDLKNAHIYYNLGNAYFKTGQSGMAIRNYRRAYFLAPRDPDIKHNLLYARAFRVDKIHISANPITNAVSLIVHSISLYEAQLLSTALIIIISLFVAGYIVFRRRAFMYVVAPLVLVTLFCFLSWGVWATEIRNRPVVVIALEATALSGPGEDYREIIKVHDGVEANLKEARNGYCLIQLPGGIGGWVKKDAIVEIF